MYVPLDHVIPLTSLMYVHGACMSHALDTTYSSVIYIRTPCMPGTEVWQREQHICVRTPYMPVTHMYSHTLHVCYTHRFAHPTCLLQTRVDVSTSTRAEGILHIRAGAIVCCTWCRVSVRVRESGSVYACVCKKRRVRARAGSESMRELLSAMHCHALQTSIVCKETSIKAEARDYLSKSLCLYLYIHVNIYVHICVY